MYIKEKIREYVPKNDLVEKVWMILAWAKANTNAYLYSDLDYTKLLWKKAKGHEPNFENPTTYDEKMWYLKLSNRDPLLTECSDKHRVRDYVISCGYEDILKKEYAVYEKADDIPFDKLPEKCYLKCNNGSGLNLIYFKKGGQDVNHIKWKFDFLLKQNPYYLSREWNYKNIRPLIICEEVLEMPDGDSNIPEIQFFCFNGEPKFIMYNLGLADEKGRHKEALRWVFDMDWNLINVVTSMPTNNNPPAKPNNLDYMIEIARKLADPFPHVRIDLFIIEEKVYFNEMTFYSGGGFVKLEPEKWQYIIGKWIDCSAYRIQDDAKQRHNLKLERKREGR